MSYDDGHASRITAEAETKTRQRLKRNNIGAVTPNAKLLKDLVNIFTKYNSVLGKCTELPQETPSISWISFYRQMRVWINMTVTVRQHIFMMNRLISFFIICFHLENQKRK